MYLRDHPFRFTVGSGIAALCVLMMTAVTAVVHAESSRVNFDISSQTLSNALVQFSHTTGVQFLYTEDSVSKTRAQGVSGERSVQEGLDELLKGTGYRYEFTNPNTVRIFKEGAASGNSGVRSTKRGNVVLAQAETESVAADPSQRSPETRTTQQRISFEELVVTAQKRAQNIQDVPITMDAFTGEQLREQAVRKADDVVKLAPNLTFNYSNEINTSISIRGVGTDNFHGNVNRAVGIYYDEAYMATPYSGVLGVFDLQRVEVLRGPQNTLFGRNTTGGAVRYISRKPVPGEPVQGYVSGTYGRFDQLDFEGGISVPLSSDIAARFSFQTVNRDGPFTNLATGHVGEELGKIERHSGRFQILWEPGVNTSVLASFQFGLNRGDNRGSKARGKRDPNDPTQFCDELPTSADFENMNSCVAITGFNPSTQEWRTLYNVSSARSDVEVFGGTFSIDHDFGWATLNSVTTYYETDVELGDDIAGIDTLQFVPHQDSTFKDFSQELRLQSPDVDRLRWILGAYYFREDLLQGTLVRRDANGAQAPGGEVTAFNILDQKDEDISVYGQVEYDPTDRLTLVAGLRYTNNQKSADSQFGVALTPTAQVPADTLISRDLVLERTEGAPEACPPPPAPCLVPLIQPEQEINEVGVRAGVNYDISQTMMAYATFSRGFKSGGFDTRALAAFFGTADRPVEEEVLNAWEIGMKSDFLSNTLRFNAAAFYYKWKDQQTFATIESIPGFLNIPGSRLMGVETTVRWIPREDWTVQVSGAFLDTEVTDDGDLEGVDEGHELKNSPDFSFNGMISKDFAMGDNNLNLQAHLRYVGEQANSLDFTNDFLTTREEQFYLDLRATYSLGPDQRYQLAIYGENLTSEKHCFEKDLQDSPVVASTGPVTSTVACSANVGRPTYGVSGSMRF